MKTYDWTMKKKLCLFTSLAISIYIFLSVLMYILASVSHQKAPYDNVKHILSGPSAKILSTKIAGVSVKLGRNDKYNWSNTGKLNKKYKQFAGVSVKLERNDKYNWSYTGELNKKYKQFAPALNITEYTMYVNLIETLKDAFERYNITYLLEGGSVLGAYRYHGFIPWDDDFDCKVNVSQKLVLKKALNGVAGHTLVSPENSRWKFYSDNFAVANRRFKWKWPFIDILFFKDNATHVYDVTFKRPRHYDPRSDILPLESCIFESMVMPVPHNTEAYLNRKYNMREPCKSHYWNHKLEKKIIPTRIPCDKLYGVYPLVHRFKIDNVSFEELRLGIKVLYRLERPSMKLLKP